ncbi:MAG: carbohydrate kinase [Spirochaetes bacterium]|nr:carbohydrate kinase [Spirochaetota bacterium]
MIICCGENLIDMVPLEQSPGRPYGGFRLAPGGCPYTSAIAAARLGADVQFLGAMASDFLGDKLFGRLKDNGVGTDFLLRVNRPVLLAFVEKSPSGEARYAFYSEGAADRSLMVADLPSSLPEEARFLLVGSISLVMEPEASAILALVDREHDKRLVSLDPNVRPSLIPDKDKYLKTFEALCASSAILKASDSDLEWLYGTADLWGVVSHILGLGVELVFLTKGERGSLAATKRYKVEVPAVQAEVVDTIGAGDTFHAAVLAALDINGVSSRVELAALGKTELEGLLYFASAAAAMDCAREGAEPPSLAELKAAYPDTLAVLKPQGGNHAHRHQALHLP